MKLRKYPKKTVKAWAIVEEDGVLFASLFSDQFKIFKFRGDAQLNCELPCKVIPVEIKL